MNIPELPDATGTNTDLLHVFHHERSKMFVITNADNRVIASAFDLDNAELIAHVLNSGSTPTEKVDRAVATCLELLELDLGDPAAACVERLLDVLAPDGATK